jgi:hypothetical protein
MTDREFRKRLHEKRLEAIRAEVLAEKNKPPASDNPTATWAGRRPLIVPLENLLQPRLQSFPRGFQRF